MNQTNTQNKEDISQIVDSEENKNNQVNFF